MSQCTNIMVLKFPRGASAREVCNNFFSKLEKETVLIHDDLFEFNELQFAAEAFGFTLVSDHITETNHLPVEPSRVKKVLRNGFKR